MPCLKLQETLNHWGRISAGLAEPLRKRKSQEEILLEIEEESI